MRWVMHVDMDAFFASVEQFRNHPHLQGQPVCVGPDPRTGATRGVVSTASYEARAFGVRSGMPVVKALQLCPQAVFVRSSYALYREASDEVIAVLREYADGQGVRVASIDEAYLDVTDAVPQYPAPADLARDVQSRILAETKLPCSIGLGPNMTVAKIATGMNKPRGITVAPQGSQAVAEFLRDLPVRAISGVGPVTADRLARHGIHTIGQVQDTDLMELMAAVGRAAEWLWKRAMGIDDRPVVESSSRMRRSISRERTLTEDIPGNDQRLRRVVQELCSMVARRVADKHLRFKCVTLKIRYSDFTTVHRSRSLTAATSDERVPYRVAADLLSRHCDPERRVRQLGVRVSELRQADDQALLTQFV